MIQSILHKSREVRADLLVGTVQHGCDMNVQRGIPQRVEKALSFSRFLSIKFAATSGANDRFALTIIVSESKSEIGFSQLAVAGHANSSRVCRG